MGLVYICTRVHGGDKDVLETPDLNRSQLWEAPQSSDEETLRELDSWRRLGIHPNVIQLFGVERFASLHFHELGTRESPQEWSIPAKAAEWRAKLPAETTSQPVE